ncbi:MAG: hypothetical protein Ct9H90mP25_1210 [Gammaproteobacteria bacterium]|nr:MAG: hypothetical protein Ct9H90mP25_1210 [Gammaproteobacteria bacterium]
MTPSKPLLVISTILALSSCSTSDQPSFRHMSDEELISYNANKPLQENVIFFKKQNTGSFIKENNVGRWQNLPQNAIIVDRLNTGE